MSKFNSDDFLKTFKPIMEGNNADKKYPSAYIVPLIQKISEFVTWITTFVEEKISTLTSQMNTRFTEMNSVIQANKDESDKLKKDIEELKIKHEADIVSTKKYADSLDKKLREDLGI